MAKQNLQVGIFVGAVQDKMWWNPNTIRFALTLNISVLSSTAKWSDPLSF